MRSGAQAPDDDSTRQFKAQSQRLMGDMNDAGDAPFGGEVQVDSQVGAKALSSVLHAHCCCCASILACKCVACAGLHAGQGSHCMLPPVFMCMCIW